MARGGIDCEGGPATQPCKKQIDPITIFRWGNPSRTPTYRGSRFAAAQQWNPT